MKKPARMTIVFGLIGGIVLLAVLPPSSGRRFLPVGLNFLIWVATAAYTVFLCRWSRTPLARVIFPLALLLVLAVRTHHTSGFLLPSLAVFSWIRSGICFIHSPLKSLPAEIITVFGAAAVIGFLQPNSAVGWALSLWLFFLVQALFFFMAPRAGGRQSASADGDAFERSRQALERLFAE